MKQEVSVLVAAGVTLAGVFLGALTSYIASTRLLRRQERERREYERWIRLLNSYQNFSHFVQLYVHLRRHYGSAGDNALAEAYKALHDADLFDAGPPGEARVASMAKALEGVENRPLSDLDETELRDQLREIYEDFEAETLGDNRERGALASRLEPFGEGSTGRSPPKRPPRQR